MAATEECFAKQQEAKLRGKGCNISQIDACTSKTMSQATPRDSEQRSMLTTGGRAPSASATLLCPPTRLGLKEKWPKYASIKLCILTHHNNKIFNNSELM